MDILNLINDMNYEFYLTNKWFLNENCKILVEVQTKIDHYFNTVNFDNFILERYIDYVFLEILSEIKNDYNDIRPEYTNCIESRTKWADDLLSSIDKGLFINYLKCNYIEIYEYSKKMKFNGLYLRHLTIKYSIKYCKDCKELMIYILINNPLEIINKFDIYKILFDSNECDEYLKRLLTKENFANLNILQNENLFKLLNLTKRKNEFLYNDSINTIYIIAKKEYFNSEAHTIMNTVFILKIIRDLFVKLGVYQAYEIDEEYKRQSIELDKYIIENGEPIKLDFPANFYAEKFKDKNISWTIRQLLLTHVPSKDDKTKNISRFESIMLYTDESIDLNLVRTNINTDDLFGYSRINNLNVSLISSIHIIRDIIRDNTDCDEFLNNIFNEILDYLDFKKIKYDENELTDYFKMIMVQIEAINKSFDEQEKLIDLSFRYYGLIMLIISIFEKVIRLIYYGEIKDEIYVLENVLVLGSLLAPKGSTNYISKVIGEGTMNCFEYILLGRNGVGLNLRNDFAHLNDSTHSNLTYSNLCLVLYLLATLGNCMQVSIEELQSQHMATNVQPE